MILSWMCIIYHSINSKGVYKCRGLDDHASLAFIKERVRVSDTRKHPNSISESIFTYEGATRSNVQYLMVENEKLEQNLQDSIKET